MRSAITTDQSPAPAGGYSQAIRWGDLLLTSGLTPRRLDGQLVDGPFAEQAAQVYANLSALAQAGGATLADALRVTVYLRDLGDAPEADAAFRAAFPEPRPARTTVHSAIPVAIEIDVILGIR